VEGTKEHVNGKCNCFCRVIKLVGPVEENDQLDLLCNVQTQREKVD